MKGRRVEYVDVGESSLEIAGREELTHFRQDTHHDFTDPTEIIFTQSGARRRTTVRGAPLVEYGPDTKYGRQTGWYLVFDNTGKYTLVSAQTADELAGLPRDALEANEYCNLIAEENPALAAKLIEFLDQVASPHTAHKTSGSDHGARSKLIYARNQLSQIPYQDSQIGDGIKVPPIRRRPKKPSALVGADKVRW